MHACMLRCSALSNSAASWTVALQAPLSVGFPRQEYKSGLPFPSPGDLPDPGINLCLLHFTTEPPGKPQGHSGKDAEDHPPGMNKAH